MATKPVYTDTQVTSALTKNGGIIWTESTITYNFPSSTSLPLQESASFSALNSSQQAMASYWMEAWDDVIGRSIEQVSGAVDSNLTFGNTSSSSYAHAYMPGSASYSGSVWLNPSFNSGTNSLVAPSLGQWGAVAIGHEIGHAMGLSHPGNYNGGSPTYALNATHMQDSQMYTIMSYFTASNTGADWIASDGNTYFAQTPMMNDIMAMQKMYGADTSTRSSDTTYGFNSTAGVSVYDFNLNEHPVLCVYDAGGIDTLDFSGFSSSSKIDLRSASFSDCDSMTKNVSIARNVIIENAIGGSAADTLLGNGKNNVLDGGAGGDIMKGGLGNDSYYVDSLSDLITELSSQGTDTVYAALSYKIGANIEHMTLMGSSDINATGNGMNNTLTGNSGNNTINGGAGNDRLVGGSGRDLLTGSTGADKFVFSAIGDSGVGAARDVITDFSKAQYDKIDLSLIDANTTLDGDQKFTWIGTSDFSSIAGQLHRVGNIVAGDINGDGQADFEIELTLGSGTLAGTNFLL